VEIQNTKMGITPQTTTNVKKEQVDKGPQDTVDLRNGLLSEMVDKGTLSKQIEERIKELRNHQTGEHQVNGETTKCYMPCYDGGPWFKGEKTETEITKCYMPCYDGGPWFKGGEQKEERLGTFGKPTCYAPMSKSVGKPTCYAPMA
jgi:hypothetical protein